MRPHFESVLLLNGFFELGHEALIEVHAGAAQFADNVVMVLAWVHQFVAALAIAEVDSLHQTKRDQRFQRSIYSRQTWCLVFFLTQFAVYILRASQFCFLLENFENALTTFSQPSGSREIGLFMGMGVNHIA